MATDKQIRANRENAKRAKGPVSAQGLSQSKKNALKHGLSGSGVVLTDEQATLVNARAAQWVEDTGAVSDDDKRLAYAIALDQVRLEGCYRRESALLRDQAERAAATWDKDQATAAAEIARKFKKEPEYVSLALERTTQGCAIKVKRWKALLRALRKGKPWDSAKQAGALDLLGEVPELRDPDGNPFGDTAEAQEAFAREEIGRLRALQTGCLDELNDLRRARAIKSLDMPEKDVWLVRRYEARCQCRLTANLGKLAGGMGYEEEEEDEDEPVAGSKPCPIDVTIVPEATSKDVAAELEAAAEAELDAWVEKLRAAKAMTLEEAVAHLDSPVVAPTTAAEFYESTARDMIAMEVVQAAREATGLRQPWL